MSSPIALNTRRELMIDDLLTEQTQGGLQMRLHQPVAREVITTTDKPWEGNMCSMGTIIRDPSTQMYRMYYRNGDFSIVANGEVHHVTSICLAESEDGIHWRRRMNHGMGSEKDSEFAGTNIVHAGKLPLSPGTVSFFPFFDTNPASRRIEGYKAIGSDNNRPPSGLFLMTSYDGLHWTHKSDEPFFTKSLSQRMRFDSVNTLFWDSNIERYRLYYRDYDQNHIRCIRMSTSKDLTEWTEPVWLDYGPDAPAHPLYTNNVQPYYRAPHHLLGFPMRYIEREWSSTMEALPELEHRLFRRDHAVGARSGTALTDGLFMSSRDGEHFKRWDEAFFRPGLHEKGNWTYGDNWPMCGMIETDAAESGDGRELSMFTVENYWRASRFRRHTLRIDGFASRWAPYAGGRWTTKPITFTGSRLSLNMSTSAAGSLRVEIQDLNGNPLPGYAMADCCEIVGDSLDYVVRWNTTCSVESLRDKPVRLCVQISDANLYSIVFRD